MKTSAVIVCGGRGSRMGAAVNKVYLPLGKSTILARTLRAFIALEQIAEIIIVYHPDDHQLLKSVLESVDSQKIKTALAGKERQNSVYNGLLACNPEHQLVLIHDGARPFISQQLIVDIIERTKKAGAVVPAMALVDTIKEVENDTNEKIKAVQRQSSLSPLEVIGAQTRKIPKVLIKEQKKEKKNKSHFTPDGHSIDAFMQENRYAEQLLKEIQKISKKIEKSPLEVHWKDALLCVTDLKEIELHYRRKEELLFPHLNQDDFVLLTENFSILNKTVKKNIRNIIQSVKSKNIKNFKALFNQTYEMIHEGIKKEEQTLFPAALSKLTETQWETIRAEGKEIGYAWIERAQDPLTAHMEEEGETLEGFRLETGFLSIEKIDQVFNSLPLEVTVVNEEDQIIYYNRHEDRIFKRLPGFIGENYINCHTGRNEKTVKKIIANFKKQKQEEIELFFNMDDKKIFVQYKPFYNHNGEYKGFIEITTDISYYRQIEGEQTDIL